MTNPILCYISTETNKYVPPALGIIGVGVTAANLYALYNLNGRVPQNDKNMMMVGGTITGLIVAGIAYGISSFISEIGKKSTC